ncbi:von Willebrand domain-containing protein [Ephemerocybe angulata]|uniref:von Willebrand domain-containing protein n=1 Tax=Ephemerocybe angulata TaxID=980116 RepID=A0A8H6IJ93_9AGAR|nr:von Willebrand domain-containing protein [Tulosesus angulatus]
MDHCGILYHSYDDTTDTFTAAQVPLEEVRVKVWIVDVTARVTLTQKFYNAGPSRTGRAKYCFPVPASAAICSFQMTSSDGKVIRGECKEKGLAQEQYEAAMASGQTAGLLEYVTDDIFNISIGHIPPYTIVETHIVYAMTLYTGDYMDQVRFQLPCYVGQRYGIPPEGLHSSVQPLQERTRVSVTADIQTSGRIQDIVSPSHASDIEETRYSTHLGRASRRRTTIRFRSNSYLDREFILTIRAKDLDKPRCYVEVRKDARFPDSLALQLTLVPKTKLPAIPEQRYLFVAKRTLTMMLRMIPAEGSSFNIFGFGNTCVGWRSKGEAYTQYTLEEATSYVEGFQADFGGTEIRQALGHVFNSSPPDMSTVVFVLTDGEATDTQGVTQEVSRFVNSSSASRRVFALGIGDEVSTDMCERIARAGNGECFFAVDTESIVQKCAKLFTASRTPFIRNVSLDWGITSTNSPAGSPEVTFSNQPSPRSVATRPLPTIQQAPPHILAIHSGTRMNIFAIITSRHAKPPKDLKIAVQQIALVHSDDDSIPLIHTMAAWKLIQEYTDNPKMPLPRPLGVATEEELRQSAIVQLGTQYQIASSHTSFIAVEGSRDSPPLEVAQHQIRLAWMAMASAIVTISSLWAVISRAGSHSPQQTSSRPPSQNGSSESLPGQWPSGGEGSGGGGSDSNPSPRASFAGDDEEPTEFGSQDSERSSVKTFSTISSHWSSASSSDWSSSYSSDSLDGPGQRAASPAFHRRQPDGNQTPRQRDSRRLEGVLPSVVELVKFQQFDGSFPSTSMARIVPFVGARVAEEGKKLSRAERDVWATVVCVAYLKQQLEEQPELLGQSFVLEGLTVDVLLGRASRVLALVD